ncbi:MAG: hypothetical protein ACSLFD_06000 [Solirubrobacterales bacterium]
MPQKEEQKQSPIEHLLADIVGTNQADPGYTASATAFHERLDASLQTGAKAGPAEDDDA